VEAGAEGEFGEVERGGGVRFEADAYAGHAWRIRAGCDRGVVFAYCRPGAGGTDAILSGWSNRLVGGAMVRGFGGVRRRRVRAVGIGARRWGRGWGGRGRGWF